LSDFRYQFLLSQRALRNTNTPQPKASSAYRYILALGLELLQLHQDSDYQSIIALYTVLSFKRSNSNLQAA